MLRMHTAALAVMVAVFSTNSWSSEIIVAVAANFTKPLEDIAKIYQQDTGNTIKISSASTGKLYTQITNGAPFDVMLSADTKTPGKLVAEHYAQADSQFTYAQGRLALWSAKEGVVDQNGKVLTSGTYQHVAMCDPKLAPYGQAALETMTHLKVLPALKPKLVQGENITQAYQFVSSGNAEIGFVALSQIYKDGKVTAGSAWIVPSSYYKPIEQDAVLLTASKDKKSAAAFLSYLKSTKTKALMQRYGYL
jgi:molybdate transport system substrate-binding protein